MSAATLKTLFGLASRLGGRTRAASRGAQILTRQTVRTTAPQDVARDVAQARASRPTRSSAFRLRTQRPLPDSPTVRAAEVAGDVVQETAEQVVEAAGEGTERTGFMAGLDRFIGKHRLKVLAGEAALGLSPTLVAGGASLFNTTRDRLTGQESIDNLEEFNRLRNEQLRVIAESQRKEEAMRENMALLARTMPHRYQELMAGMPLAPGERVYGQTQSSGLVEQLAMDMATGVVTPPASAQQSLLDILGQ